MARTNNDTCDWRLVSGLPPKTHKAGVSASTNSPGPSILGPEFVVPVER